MTELLQELGQIPTALLTKACRAMLDRPDETSGPAWSIFAAQASGWSIVTDGVEAGCENRAVTLESLVRELEDFLASARDAVIVEDGAVVFDLAQSKYSISGERNKCVLHVWSAE